MIAPGLAMFPHTAGVKGERAFLQNILRTRLPREPLKSQHSLLCPLQLTQTVCWTRQRAQHKPRPTWKPLEAEAAQRFDRKPESNAEYQDTSDASGVFWTWRTFPCWSGLKFDEGSHKQNRVELVVPLLPSLLISQDDPAICTCAKPYVGVKRKNAVRWCFYLKMSTALQNPTK